MTTEPTESVEVGNEIKETDIVFDCPHCGKSLAIDYRGAGLSIPCTDCGKSVSVPIPDGMELRDIDGGAEEQELRLMNLRKTLGVAQARIRELEQEVESVNLRRESLERDRAENMKLLATLGGRIGLIRDALRSIEPMLDEAEKMTRPPSKSS